MSTQLSETHHQQSEPLDPARSATAFSAVIWCPRPAYRRAGFTFTRGRTTLDPVTPEQLAILEQDPCLVVESSSPAALQPAQPGAVDDSGVGGVTPAKIRAAVASLDSENTEHFTQAGKPRVAAVVAALGAEVTGKQIEAALAEDGDDA
ncbi:TPA: HI1506-related protein [Serratia marcescens]